jgi:hypothetical protein
MAHKLFKTGTESIALHPSIHVAEYQLQSHQSHVAKVSGQYVTGQVKRGEKSSLVAFK